MMDICGYGYIHGYPRKICGYGYGYGWIISYPRQACHTGCERRRSPFLIYSRQPDTHTASQSRHIRSVIETKGCQQLPVAAVDASTRLLAAGAMRSGQSHQFSVIFTGFQWSSESSDLYNGQRRSQGASRSSPVVHSILCVCYAFCHGTLNEYERMNVHGGRLPADSSADTNALAVPRTYTRLGDRSFPVAGPIIWNSLPASLRQSDIEFRLNVYWRHSCIARPRHINDFCL